jgi:hypothetical protein
MIRFAGTVWPYLHTATGIWLLLTSLTVAVRPSTAQDVLTAPPVLNGGIETQRATAGFYTLSWNHPASDLGLRYEVQEAARAGFVSPRTIYSGSDLATFVSGKRDGTLYYRARARPAVSDPRYRWSPWSTVLAVTTAHHSRARAFAFLAVGAFVFLATVALIVVGNRANSETG